jgi:hypothetical protein
VARWAQRSGGGLGGGKVVVDIAKEVTVPEKKRVNRCA